MSSNELTVGTMRKENGKYCILFSNGRKECFDSEDSAKKRERQVKFFKSQAKSHLESGETLQEMANLGIASQYALDGADDAVYVVQDGEEFNFFVVKGEAGSRDVVLLTPEDVSEAGDYSSYSPIIEFITEESTAESDEIETFELSESVVGEQLVAGSHTHTARVDGNGDGKTTEDAGHTHYVHNGYISPSYVKINGIDIMHTHLRRVKPTN